MTDLLINMVLFTLVILFAALSGSTLHNSFTNSKRLEFDQLHALSLTVINVDEILNMFDSIISDCFIEYSILEFAYKEDKYINSEMEQEILSNISSMVLTRITEAVIAKLLLIYNIPDEEALTDIITRRTYIKVIDFVISHNRPLEE